MVRHRWELRTRAAALDAPRSRVRLGAGRAATLCVLFAALAWISASLLFHPPARAGEELGRIELEGAVQGQARAAQDGPAQPGGEVPPTEGAVPGGQALQHGSPRQDGTLGHGGIAGPDGGQAPNGPDPQGGTSAVDVVVHVAGAVKRPGVYRLPSGTRAHEAADAAGGLTGKANAGAVNLAAPLTDGQQLYIPERGEPVPPGGSSPGGGSGAGTAPPGGQEAAGTVNLNTATSGELQRLPGIGPALAERIIAFRQDNGPFGSLAELDAVSGIGPAVLSRLEGRVSFL
ncbi:competence protein ComEA [Zafaria cholistanensis]|uniref:Competence protein ComEA n=1 Tax=Zafaria cholistanensis TaxID=1682741 RepID=A0A5A7NQ65_9MICC|nr:ComEA family DNA-binding protein [Zafaria cholistanensis]GER22157.1 competence protein ComEA [Zafaria cholistanensis]